VGNVVVAHEGRIVREVPVRIGRLIIGRTPDNDLQIDSRFISRHHCQIIATLDGCVIEDLNSTNGIFVEDRRVRRHPLANGDTVNVGKHALTFRDNSGPDQISHTLTVPALRLVPDAGKEAAADDDDGDAPLANLP
jgi:pSer/pThr/pTyr-binding forkhead associated (FHA) protein